MGFDPNTLPEKTRPEWATYIGSRRPKFKQHSNRGQALNAAAYYPRSCQIFRWDFDKSEWVEVWNGVVNDIGVSKGEICERCHKSTMTRHVYKRSTGNGGYEEGVRVYNAGTVGWLKTPTNKSKLVEPFQRAWLCKACK